jgi:hypothetical protein
VLWFQGAQLERAAAAWINPPLAAGPQPFCKYWHSCEEHFGAGSADVYHGFGLARSGQHTTDCSMPASMLDLFEDNMTWD